MAGDSERSRDFEKGRHRTMMWNGFVCSLMLFSGAARKINQSPQRITVTEGGTVQLNCTFSLKSSHQGDKIIGSISWYKDVEDRCVCATCSGYQGRVLLNSSISILSESLQITNLSMNDTGKYYCKVDIFMEAQYLGNGTEVTIRHFQNHRDYADSTQTVRVEPTLLALCSSSSTSSSTRGRNTAENNGRGLHWQMLEMGVKLAIFVVINIVTVFLIRSRECHGIVNRNKVI